MVEDILATADHGSPQRGVYDKNCGEKMLSKKMYLAPGENIEVMLKWVPTPKNLEERRWLF